MKRPNLQSIALFNDHASFKYNPYIKKSTLFKIAEDHDWTINKIDENSLEITIPNGETFEVADGFRFPYGIITTMARKTFNFEKNQNKLKTLENN